MKKVYIAVAGLTALIALILLFQNIANTAQMAGYFFKSTTGSSLFFPMGIMFILGIICGICLGLLQSVDKKPDGDIESDF